MFFSLVIMVSSDGLSNNILDQIVSDVTTHDDVSNAGTCFLLGNNDFVWF